MTRPLRPCATPGCLQLVRSDSHCPAHARQARRAQEGRRANAAQRGYGRQWRQARSRFLRQNPTCAACGAPATVVDHIQPHHGDHTMFWDRSNWQALCGACHGRKTRREGG